MSVTEQTLTEVIESMTGFDEIAVEQSFHRTLAAMQEQGRGTEIQRSGVFVLRRREGDSDHAARHYAMNLTLRELNDYFTPEPEEIDPEDPETEPGKEPSSDDSVPPASPTSA